ncbi:mitochondrial coenzyme A diphosphatase NUDT8-like [Bicyclus anynana]|uniref:Mitochondrial coenzyme A diphosphatase NUDT8-like n=1 Tax=Bicyclus anynana TaxID=110368 RepID=A0A6J1NP73_BICAN|nr:mitochondrial coenzyme A diphosphatase NUDT8-like [Bicyclus anynana]
MQYFAYSIFSYIMKIMNTAAFGLQYIISSASRERCMSNLKKFRVPSLNRTGKPSATAAVLIPLCNVNERISLLYTVRATNLRSDSGNISFPGGKTDKSESPIETALRETKEEIGLSPKRVEIWGCGEAVPGRKNKIMISPVIGFIRDLQESDLCVNRNEVSEAFAAPLDMLCDSNNQFYTQFKNGYILPVFVINEFKIWGVTAYMTHVFLSCLLPKDVYKNNWMRNKIIVK